MIAGIQVKVCGLTRIVDAQAAAAAGADQLGFIFYPPSPRHLGIERYAAISAELPRVARVAVCVEPSPVDLARLAELGFAAFQIHFKADTPHAQVAAWSDTVGASRLWLAPKLPPAQDVRPEWLALAETFLLDTFHAEKFGGTGETGDWEKFQRHRLTHPGRNWVLSGGLNPGNVRAAVQATGAVRIDVNSGVETAPGVKDAAKLTTLVAALQGA
ncbi:MAG: phosphoribosylanthranilate isomerase [Candidatus Didemnitutus sp.]|nr:phosphoribosylanthranilate isomerase [Candidatus Didemnitutus sp.]